MIVVIAKNPLDPASWKRFETDNFCEFIMSQFEAWPSTARIYDGYVSQVSDVTPADEAGIQRLNQLKGPLFVVVYPGAGPWLIVAIVAIVALTVAATFLLRPATPNVALRNNRNTQDFSSNNALSDRQNQARINGRITDIFGTVRSTPDLIAAPYRVFKDHREIEIAYMCVGKGDYEISDIRDDTTLISQIDGASVEVYGSGTSPNSGVPTVTIGEAIDYPLVTAARLNAVNGQSLPPQAGAQAVSGNMNIRFISPDTIDTTGTSTTYTWNGEDYDTFTINFSFSDYFHAGQTLVITGSEFDDGMGHSGDLNGTYEIVSVTATQIVLDDPSAVNSDWDIVALIAGAATDYLSPSLSSSGDAIIGPFIIELATTEMVYANFVAVNGLYKDDGSTQFKTDVEIRLTLTPVDLTDTPTGAPEDFDITVMGSATERSQRAATLTAEPTFTGRCKVEVKRLTEHDTEFTGQVVDEVKWRDCYAIAPVVENHFGNVTTVYTETLATEGALAVKERKLNMLATRKIPTRISGTTFGGSVATNRADEILAFVCFDAYIGNRLFAEVNLDSIYDTVAEAEAYFGSSNAIEFCYSFDKTNLSFEETLAIIADAIFCKAYRRGSTINLSFEKETADSTLLFNHRNKVPGTEMRSVTFGNTDNFDGVSLDYVSPEDDAIVTYYIPDDRTATNPKEIQSVGIRNGLQAYFQAWRTWNKIRYQNTAVEFEATQQAEIIVLLDRILVTDNTRGDIQDGHVKEQNVLELTLSQPVDLSGDDFYIVLQHIDGTLESIAITAGTTNYNVVLATPPRLPLAVDPDLYARTVYEIVGNADTRQRAFLVTEKEPRDNFTTTVRAVNYDARYYANDQDFNESIVDNEGNLL